MFDTVNFDTINYYEVDRILKELGAELSYGERTAHLGDAESLGVYRFDNDHPLKRIVKFSVHKYYLEIRVYSDIYPSIGNTVHQVKNLDSIKIIIDEVSSLVSLAEVMDV